MLGAAGIRLPRGPPKQRIIVRSFSHDDDGADETVTFNHLPKAGGTFVRAVMAASMKPQSTKIESEGETLTPEELLNTFVVGIIRNPFDYYISLWCYNSDGMGGFRQSLSEKEKEECLGKKVASKVWGDTDDDRKRFRKWVRLVNHEELGVLSYRFFLSYVSRPDDVNENAWFCRTARQEIQRNSSLLAILQHGYQAVKQKICWIHTEHIVDDTRSCLEKYESPTGRGSKVDWELFEKKIATSGRNPTNHATCSAFYDKGTRDYVLKSDRHMFEAFGRYSGECLT